MAHWYPDFGHAQGIGAAPWFSIRDGKVYPDFGHPSPGRGVPWFKMR